MRIGCKVAALVLLCGLVAGACGSTRGGEPRTPDGTPSPAVSGDAPAVRHFEFSTETLIPAALTATAPVDVWIPAPTGGGMQQVVLRSLDVGYAGDTALRPSGVETEQLREERQGNELIHVALSRGVVDDVLVRATWAVERDELPGRDGAPDGSGRQDEAAALRPDRLVPLDGEIAALAASVLDGPDVDTTARALFDLVRERMTYDKQAPGWGQGDAVRACEVGRGNCTDFHALFIGLARAKGIPARFTIGYSLPETDTAGEPLSGYHCWAEYHSPARGWVPVDISEADKRPEREAEYFGRLTTNRIAISSGRDLVLSPAQAGPPLNYFIRPYAEREGVPVEGLTYVVSTRDT